MYPAINFEEAIVRQIDAGKETWFEYCPGDATRYVVCIAEAVGATLMGYSADEDLWRVSVHNLWGQGQAQEAYVTGGNVRWAIGKSFGNQVTCRAVEALTLHHLWPDLPNPAADEWSGL